MVVVCFTEKFKWSFLFHSLALSLTLHFLYFFFFILLANRFHWKLLAFQFIVIVILVWVDGENLECSATKMRIRKFKTRENVFSTPWKLNALNLKISKQTHIHSTSIPQCKYNEKRFVSLSMQFLRFFRSFFFSFFCSFSSKFIFEQSNRSVRYMLYVMNIKIPNCSNTLNSIYLLSSPLGVYCVYLMKIENGNRTYKCECISRHIVTVFRLKYLS